MSAASLVALLLSHFTVKRSCLIIISKLFFKALPIPLSDTVCVVSVIVKHPVLLPSVVDGRSRNPLYYYYYYYFSVVTPSLGYLTLRFLDRGVIVTFS